MINVNNLKRNAKNLVKNYSEAQIKVREATSNDPWGPSSTIMAEISDLTYNVMAFSEIMQMIWKRLNDSGKNWRHVYKALVLLEYLIKTGTEKVAQQCRENIFAIQTLKDFQYMEEGKDCGINVRVKSKALVALLKDGEKLKSERARALKTKERLMSGRVAASSSQSQSMSSTDSPPSGSSSGALGSGGFMDSGTILGAIPGQVNPSSSLDGTSPEIEQARPQTATEEDAQLQLALAISKEEADQQEKLRKHDDLRLKLALGASQKETSTSSLSGVAAGSTSPSTSSSNSNHRNKTNSSTVDDLLGLSWPTTTTTTTAFGAGSNSDSFDPWSTPPRQQQIAQLPQLPQLQQLPQLSQFSQLPQLPQQQHDIWKPKTVSKNPFDD